jgi:hypothetical protein
MLRARVFISCGQNKETDEVEIAGRIAKVLDGLGYEPYIAVVEQTLKGLTDNIFARLKESEYFLFIDFKRDRLTDRGLDCCRGSLFSHQELGIAAFLKKPVIAFREKSVIWDDGIMGFLQANCEQFSDRSDLPRLVAAKVPNKWKPDWRNELEIRREEGQFQDEVIAPSGGAPPRPVRFFHLDVVNSNPFETAINCCAYLVNTEVLPQRRELPLQDVEFKWRGVLFPTVMIPPSRTRQFDAFLSFRDDPGHALTGALTDSWRHRYGLQQGDYLITFAVRSENFPEARKTFLLKVGGGTVENIVFSGTVPTTAT